MLRMHYMLGVKVQHASELMTETKSPSPAKPLTPEARRALEEAAARRTEIDAHTQNAPTEYNGRGGKEPVRYGDWEVKGIASDF